MDLPVMPPVEPMLAKSVPALPLADGMAYEPKWDGFRCLVFRDGDEIELASRGKKLLTRYFPEVLDPLCAALPERCVVDGELVIVGPNGLEFDTLQARIHPAASRVQRLAVESPAAFVAFDLLAVDDRRLLDEPFAERRRLLTGAVRSSPLVHLTPHSTDPAVAADWFERFEGAGFDGVMAKSTNDTYQPGKRVQFKVKHERTADCVVAGFRWHKDGQGVGSLMLGLYDAAGVLHSVGVASSFSAAVRIALLDEVGPVMVQPGDPHPWADAGDPGRPGAPNRWNATKDMTFVLLRPERVVEVAYDHLQGSRFRHTTRFRRWRDDRRPDTCTYAQLETVPPAELAEIFISTG